MKHSLFPLLFFAYWIVVFFSQPSFAEEDSHKIYPLRPSRIADYVEFTKGQKRALVIYASWCPYCRAKVPDLIKMEGMKKGSIIAVSEDKNLTDFSKYIRSLDEIPYKVILSNPKGGDFLPSALEQFGIKEWNSYPTVILLNEKNQAVSQGNLSSQQIARFLFYSNTN